MKYKCQKECYWAYPTTTSRLWTVGEEVDIKDETKPPKFFVPLKEWKEPEEPVLFRRKRFIGHGGQAGMTFSDFAREHHVQPPKEGMAAGIQDEPNAVPARKGRTQEKVAN